MKLPIFRETIEQLSQFMKAKFDVDLLKFFTEPPYDGSLEKKMPLIPLTAIQVKVAYLIVETFHALHTLALA